MSARCSIYEREYSEHARKLTQDSGSCKPVVPVAYASDSVSRSALLSGNNGYECCTESSVELSALLFEGITFLDTNLSDVCLDLSSYSLIMQDSNQQNRHCQTFSFERETIAKVPSCLVITSIRIIPFVR